MVARRAPGLAAIALIVAACGAADTPPSLLSVPKPGSIPAGTATAVTPFGAPPVVPPAPLRSAASAYYDGAGPAPQVEDGFRPACLLMLPTSLHAAPVKAVPQARFNVFDEFEVTWTRAVGRGTGLALFVYPPGDPSDLEFFRPDARTATLADGTELRSSSARPQATLLRVPTQNCEYELEGDGSIPAAALDRAVRSLRLVFAP